MAPQVNASGSGKGENRKVGTVRFQSGPPGSFATNRWVCVVEQLSTQRVTGPQLFLRSQDQVRKAKEGCRRGAQMKEDGGRNYNHRAAPVDSSRR